MKLMNEIQAETSGEVVEIYARTASRWNSASRSSV
jgi:biotin carboxyl carrier protein